MPSIGASGEISLGTTLLNTLNLASYADRLAQFGSYLSNNGDMLLYGCNVEAGMSGIPSCNNWQVLPEPTSRHRRI